MRILMSYARSRGHHGNLASQRASTTAPIRSLASRRPVTRSIYAMSSFGRLPELSEPLTRRYLAHLQLDFDLVSRRDKDLALLSELVCDYLSLCANSQRSLKPHRHAQIYVIPFESFRIHVSDAQLARGHSNERIGFQKGDCFPGALFSSSRERH